MIAAAVSFGSFVLLHILESDTIRVLKDPVSTYVLTRSGALLFGLGSLGLAVGCLAVLFGPLGSEKVIRWMLGGSVLFLLFVVGFDTDAGASVSTIGGYVHRYAAGVVFVLITVAVMHTWRCYRGTGYGRIMGVFMVANLVLLVVNWSGTYQPQILNGGQWRGLPQRILLGVFIAVVLLMAFAPRIPAPRPSTPRPSTVQISRMNTQRAPVVKHGESKDWLSGRGGSGRGALPSADGL